MAHFQIEWSLSKGTRASNARPNARSPVYTLRQPLAGETFFQHGSVTMFWAGRREIVVINKVAKLSRLFTDTCPNPW